MLHISYVTQIFLSVTSQNNKAERMTHLKNKIKIKEEEEEEKNAQHEYLSYNHSLFTTVYLTTMIFFTRVYLTLLTARVYAQ